MHRQWKFDQILKKWTWLHMIVFSFSIMKKHVSFDSEMSFVRFRWKCDFAIRGEKVCLMEFDERKSFEVDGKNALIWTKWDKFKFSYSKKKILTQQTSIKWKILKTRTKSSLLSKILSKTLTLVLLSLSPNLNGTNETHRIENGSLYRRR